MFSSLRLTARGSKIFHKNIFHRVSHTLKNKMRAVYDGPHFVFKSADFFY